MLVVDDGQEWKVVDGARYCTGLAWRNDHLRTNRPLGICASLAARPPRGCASAGRPDLRRRDTHRPSRARHGRSHQTATRCGRCFEHGRHRRLSMPLDTIGLKVRARSKFHNIPRSMISCRIEPGYLFRESPKHFGNLTGVNASTSGRAPMGPRRSLDPKPSAVAFG